MMPDAASPIAYPELSVPLNHLTARDAVLRLRGSKIREVANASLGRSDVLAFWFGEPDELTPEFIRRAGIASLEAGETFYTHNFGIAATVVNGEILLRDGKHTGALPGKLLRGPLAHAGA